MNNAERHPAEIHVIDVYLKKILVNTTDDFLRLIISRFNMMIPNTVDINAIAQEVIQLHGDDTVIGLVSTMKV